MTFRDLNIAEPILRAVEGEGYTNPTPIQEQAIPILLRGKDLLGVAQTGTGKTAAFGIPILHHLYRGKNGQQGKRCIKALIVTPTRELAIQIGESFTAYGKFTGLRNTVIFGGVKQGKQVKVLQNGVDILVATPGRLLDLMNQGYISFRDLEFAVLDEADQMLDMGFIHDIKKIIAKLPAKRQSLFFSATMPRDIVDLSRKILGDFERVTIKPEQATAEKVEQGVYFISKKNKPKLLVHLLQERSEDSVLVFSRTKHGANKIVKKLAQAGIRSAAIHGNKSQTARQKAYEPRKDYDTRIQSPGGAWVFTDHGAEAAPAFLRLIDKGLDRVKTVAEFNGYTHGLHPSVYDVTLVARSPKCTNAGFTLAFEGSGPGSYDQTKYDKNPEEGQVELCVAGQFHGAVDATARRFWVSVVADPGTTALATEYEVEHALAWLNDYDLFQRTKYHQNGGHPILRQPDSLAPVNVPFTPGTVVFNGKRMSVLLVE